MLKLLQTSTKVKQFLIKDLFVRAKRTLNSASKENFAKLNWNDNGSEKLVLVNNFREKVEVEAILDPMNLILLTKQFIELGFIDDEKFAETIVALVDLTMLYSWIFITDRPTLVSLHLLEHARYLIKAAITKVELFRGKSDFAKRLTSRSIVSFFLNKVEIT